MASEPTGGQAAPLTRLRPGREREGLFIEPVYHRRGLEGALPEVWLRRQVVEQLVRALPLLTQEGTALLVLDGWRSRSLQAALWEDYRAKLAAASDLAGEALERRLSEFVAPPDGSDTPPAHSTGGAVDVTLCTPDGRPIDMGGDFDELTDRSHPDFYERPDLTDTERAYRDRRRLLMRAMTSAGFHRLETEWWHFEYGTPLWAARVGSEPFFGEAAAPDRA